MSTPVSRGNGGLSRSREKSFRRIVVVFAFVLSFVAFPFVVFSVIVVVVHSNFSIDFRPF